MEEEHIHARHFTSDFGIWILFSLLRGLNVYETAAKLLSVVAGSANDTDKDGTDDPLAGCLLSLSDGIPAYAVRHNNQHGNVVDGLIAAL